MDETYPQNQTVLRRPVRSFTAPEEKKQRIKTWMGACMAIAALCVDGIQALLTVVGIGLVLSPIISICANFIFWIWFLILGVPFVASPKKLFTMAGSGLVELIPAVDMLPMFTVGVIAVIIMTMSEDKGGIIGKAAGAIQGKIK